MRHLVPALQGGDEVPVGYPSPRELAGYSVVPPAFVSLHEKTGVKRIVEESHPAKFSDQGLRLLERGSPRGEALPDLPLRTGRTGEEPENPEPMLLQ